MNEKLTEWLSAGNRSFLSWADGRDPKYVNSVMTNIVFRISEKVKVDGEDRIFRVEHRVPIFQVRTSRIGFEDVVIEKLIEELSEEIASFS